MSGTNKVNRGRTLARSQALQLLFQAEALDRPVDYVLDGDYLISKGPLDPYAVELARGTYANRTRIDASLRAVSKNWSLERMPGPDRNLLRLAVFEMRLLPEDEKLDDAVVIDEAVEVAKAYGTDESARFVNGVLGRIARDASLPVCQAGDGVDDDEGAEAEAGEGAEAAPGAAEPATGSDHDVEAVTGEDTGAPAAAQGMEADE